MSFVGNETRLVVALKEEKVEEVGSLGHGPDGFLLKFLHVLKSTTMRR